MIPPLGAEMRGVPAKFRIKTEEPLPSKDPVDPVSFVGQKNSRGSEANSLSGIDVFV
ncbi:hypothetical protein [Leptospira stimsonii]|uniref:hypothetical protein n=1 Tax=Leptospira stimsonii TaxID=2202203 RepID=UPI0013147CA2|nr:hypothetical protein [Leptospira stimsonii]